MSEPRGDAEPDGAAEQTAAEQTPGAGDAPVAEEPHVPLAPFTEPEPRSGLAEPAPRPVAPLATPAHEPPTPQVAPVEAESVLPGRHRGGFQRLPTAPGDITLQSSPADPDGAQDGPPIQWILPPPPKPTRGLAGWALAFAILALVASLFVGWGFPLGIVAIVAAILALRRPIESRPVAVWAIVLGALSILYSAGWLLFAATSAGLIG